MPKKKEITEASFLARVSRHGTGLGVGIPVSLVEKFPHKELVQVTIQLVDDVYKEKVFKDVENPESTAS